MSEPKSEITRLDERSRAILQRYFEHEAMHFV
jgi:hypothetical protein